MEAVPPDEQHVDAHVGDAGDGRREGRRPHEVLGLHSLHKRRSAGSQLIAGQCCIILPVRVGQGRFISWLSVQLSSLGRCIDICGTMNLSCHRGGGSALCLTLRGRRGFTFIMDRLNTNGIRPGIIQRQYVPASCGLTNSLISSAGDTHHCKTLKYTRNAGLDRGQDNRTLATLSG